MQYVKCKICGATYPYIILYFRKKYVKKEHKGICKDCLDKINHKPVYDEAKNKKDEDNKTQEEPWVKKKSKSAKQVRKYAYEKEFKKVRPTVLTRDEYKCVLCGSADRVNVHHINERSKGGGNDLDNLITLCHNCHKDEHKNEPVYQIMI